MALIATDGKASEPGCGPCYDGKIFDREVLYVQHIINEQQLIRSKPTRCLKCGLVNEMTHSRDTDPKTGGWTCSRCGHLYRFAHWKIKKAGRESKVALIAP